MDSNMEWRIEEGKRQLAKKIFLVLFVDELYYY